MYRSERVRRRFLVNTLKSVPCADCGGEFDPVCMDFDHLEPKDKRFNVAQIAMSHGVPLATLIREVNKCEVVCSNCHRLRTWKPATN